MRPSLRVGEHPRRLKRVLLFEYQHSTGTHKDSFGVKELEASKGVYRSMTTTVWDNWSSGEDVSGNL